MEARYFETELASLRPMLYQFTRKFTRDRDESLDLVQDTILKALSNRSKFRDDVNLKGWLYTIMRNTFINHYRKHSKFKKSVGETAEFHYLNTEETHTFNRPEGTAQWKELWMAIENIREDIRKPFKMYTTGYKYHEIADHLNLPLGTVKNRIFQARQELQKQLTGYC
jgi:RNA polymerase sigma factor (sigma-70 family)